jgi:hypothetical protein
MYLHHVLPEIERQERVELSELPQGLIGGTGYYADHWRRMRANGGRTNLDWGSILLPVISVLAAAREPVSVPFISKVLQGGGFSACEPAVVRAAIDTWSQFLVTSRDKGGSKQYRIYHSTFAAFLEGSDALADLRKMDTSRWIADFLLNAWSDTENGAAYP